LFAVDPNTAVKKRVDGFRTTSRSTAIRQNFFAIIANFFLHAIVFF